MKSAAGDSAVLHLPGGYGIPDRAGSVLPAHFCGTVPRTSWIRGLGKGTSSPPLIQLTKISEATRGRFRLSSHEPRERPVRPRVLSISSLLPS
jgi:hypothetical protein